VPLGIARNHRGGDRRGWADNHRLGGLGRRVTRGEQDEQKADEDGPQHAAHQYRRNASS
jgi:hypothetical protein